MDGNVTPFSQGSTSRNRLCLDWSSVTEAKRRGGILQRSFGDTFVFFVCWSLNRRMISVYEAVVVPCERLHRLVTLFAESLHGGLHVDDNGSPSVALWTLESKYS